MPSLKVDIADERLMWTIDYVASSARSNQLETWAQTWIAQFDKLDPRNSIAPDGDILVTYRDSLSELLARP